MIPDRQTGVLGEGDVLDDRYALVRKLGTGGSATVFLADDLRLGRQVAVKLLHPHPGRPTSPRIEREARQAAALSHPNVVQIHDVVVDGGDDYIVLEYVAGTPLDELLRQDGPFSEGRTIELGLMVASALAAAHAEGVVHRDVKPSNVLVRPDGTAKLADFGTARMGHGDTITEEGTIIGSAAYVAPEQVQGGQVDHRADVYGLGILLYEVATGERPFVGDSVAATVIQRLHRDPVPPSSHRPVSAGLEAVILRAMARDPGDRYPDAAALAADLRALAPANADVTQPIPALALAGARRPRLARVVGGTALGLALVIGASLAVGWGSAVGSPEDPIVSTGDATVPELRGLTHEAAVEKARAAGFAIRSTRQVPASSTAGTVVDQVPGAGTQLPAQQGIVLLLSGGPGASSTETAEPEATTDGGSGGTTGGSTGSTGSTGSGTTAVEPPATTDGGVAEEPKPANGRGKPDEPGARGKANGRNG